MVLFRKDVIFNILYCSGYESINARVYVCDNLCTVLGKNAPNGYTEIHQSILNSYNIYI